MLFGFESLPLRQMPVSENSIKPQFMTQTLAIPAAWGEYGVPLNSIWSHQISSLGVCRSVCSRGADYGEGIRKTDSQKVEHLSKRGMRVRLWKLDEVRPAVGLTLCLPSTCARRTGIQTSGLSGPASGPSICGPAWAERRTCIAAPPASSNLGISRR
jgi:hypothetical protein